MNTTTPVSQPGTAQTPCGCGKCSSSAGQSATGTGFTRPTFFPGQLLTDDDFQSLINYFRGKNRLHNRHFYGDGVVCGLQVKPLPCEKECRKVAVQPGHALDCCGEDIVVSCPVELDVFDLIQQLRTKQRGGYDCGDPCHDKSNGSDLQKYFLYMRYDETETEPVTPFDVGDACQSDCVHSRIREGYQFELCCPPKATPSSQSTQNVLVSNSAMLSINHLPVGTASSNNGSSWTINLSRGLEDCLSRIKQYQKYSAAAVQAWALFRTIDKVNVQFVALDEENKKLTDVDRTNLIKSAQKQLGEITETTPPEIAIDNLHQAVTILSRGLIVPNLTEEAFTPFGESKRKILDLIMKQASSKPFGVLLNDVITKLPDEFAKVVPVTDFDGRARVVGEMLTLKNVEEACQGLTNIVEELRCDLASNGFEAPLELKTTFGANLAVDPKSYEGEREKLAAVLRFLTEHGRRCFCEQIFPPCPTCDDPRVLLASVTVNPKLCKVVDVCNLERRIIPTVPTQRYWFGQTWPWEQLLHQGCCPSPEDKSRAKSKLDDERTTQRTNWLKSNDVVGSINPKKNESDWKSLGVDDPDNVVSLVIAVPREIMDLHGPVSERLYLGMARLAGVPAAEASLALGTMTTGKNTDQQQIDALQKKLGALEQQIAKLTSAGKSVEPGMSVPSETVGGEGAPETPAPKTSVPGSSSASAGIAPKGMAAKSLKLNPTPKAAKKAAAKKKAKA